MTRLIADIGGTNARFALVDAGGAIADERTLLVRDYPDPASAIAAYLGGRRAEEAVIAVATPVESDEIGFTNSPWRFSIASLKSELGLRELAVINDFAAQALAMPHLGPHELGHRDLRHFAQANRRAARSNDRNVGHLIHARATCRI